VRTKLILALAVSAMLAIGTGAVAVAQEEPFVFTCVLSTLGEAEGCPGFPGLSARFGIGVAPPKLPKREMAPVAIELWGKVATSDGTHPSALREATIDLDRNFAIDARGLPVCHGGGRDSIETACAGAVVGSGRADFEIAFPERQQLLRSSKLTAYNLGVKGSVVTLVVTARLTVPVPRVIAIPVEIEKINGGRSGLRAVAAIPVIAGGSGSLIDFRLRLKRLFEFKGSRKSYAMARCPEGSLNAEIEAVFKNEAHEPGVAPTTTLQEALAAPCTPAV
jgi:hypothetical protein